MGRLTHLPFAFWSIISQNENLSKEAKEEFKQDKAKIEGMKQEETFFKELSNGDKFFKDAKGKVHKLSKETQEQWLKTFNLKSIDEDFIPTFTPEVKAALGNKELKLTKGSLLKLVSRKRTQYLNELKQTLEKPDMIIRHEGDYILAKQINDNLYFTSIGKDYDTHITIVSNAPKKQRLVNRKIKEGELIYQSQV